MTEPEIPLAPGCFGSAMTYKDTASECKSCEFGAQCAPRSIQRLAELRARLGINVKPSNKKSTKSPVQDVVDRVFGEQIDVAKLLCAGVNPFLTGFPAHLAVAGHLLMRVSERRLALDALIVGIQFKLKQERLVATALATEAFLILDACDAVTRDGDTIKLKEKS